MRKARTLPLLMFTITVMGASPAAAQDLSQLPLPAGGQSYFQPAGSPRRVPEFRLFCDSASSSVAGSAIPGGEVDFKVQPGLFGGCPGFDGAGIHPGCGGWVSQTPAQSTGSGTTGPPVAAPLKSAKPHGIYWGTVLFQSFEFISVEHALRMAFDPPSRREMQGKFWKDYVNSIKTLHGWSDGNHFFVNYVGHPLQGAVSGWILIQNDPKGRVQRFGGSRNYWISRAKALGWATAYSLYWELGFPLSEAAIGNLGPEGRPGLGAVDLVITGTVGTAYLVTEDFLDRFPVRAIERKWCNPVATALARSVINVNRSFANLLRWKYPWYRDDRSGLRGCGN